MDNFSLGNERRMRKKGDRSHLYGIYGDHVRLHIKNILGASLVEIISL